MTQIGDKAVVLARQWLGTPDCHQACAKGYGADCLGLVRGVWAELYGAAPPSVPAYRPDWAETGTAEVLWQNLARLLQSKARTDALPGDILLFRMKNGALAKHLGIQSAAGSAPRFIHAYWGHGVVESPLSLPWARRIVARFSFPDAE